ncbi:Rha family transcriptional regulator [Glaesserella parasuis]|uniref:Rha family transcriptional regulator n=1 Tax=Glaesserella parasuis TaxID=738 RepID=UPI00156AF87D|nr:Rha family transcriptional regulator [Glaesserella parasuis]QKJ69834.1 Rha family transcriptional regulator [Glaesserella parasuis]
MSLQKIENFEQFLKVNDKQRIVTTSKHISTVFGKRHDNIIRDIKALIIEQDCGEFALLNFEETSYVDEWGRKQPMYQMTKNGFLLLVMGYRTKKAMKFKVEFIKAFDLMRDKLKKEGYNLIHKYNELTLEHQAEKRFASLCGKALNEWKGKKPLLEATLKIFEDKMQIELPILTQ